MSNIGKKLEQVADAVYNKGVSDQKSVSVDWDIIQEYGRRKYWPNAFAYWGNTELKPKYMIKPTQSTGAQSMFQGSYITNADWSKFDFSECPTIYTAFNSCPFIENIGYNVEKDSKGNEISVTPIEGFSLNPTGNMVAMWDYMFSADKNLKRIKLMSPKLNCTYKNTFKNNQSLEEIRFSPYDADAGIGIGEDISFEDSPKLSRESIVSILEALSPHLNTDGTIYKTLTFSTELNFIDKMRDCVFGLYNKSGMVCDNNMLYETGTINGLEYTKDGGEITLNGTTTAETIINLSAIPITFPDWKYGMSVQFQDCYNRGFNDWLYLTLQHEDGSEELISASSSAGFSMGYFNSGDAITSIDLVIPEGVTFNEQLGGVSLYIDYLYWIEETLLYRGCWNIVY
jgi:hypothetical protein